MAHEPGSLRDRWKVARGLAILRRPLMRTSRGAPPRRLAFFALLLALLAPRAIAQEHKPPVDRPAELENAHDWDIGPERVIELAFSSDGLSLGYRDLFQKGNGFTHVGLLLGDDDDYALSGRLVRFGQPRSETPLGLGIGIGLVGASVDVSDEELLALTITGIADYQWKLDYPLRLGVELSYAPDAASFFDGEQVIDALARAELELSTWAHAFLGYRHFEVKLEDRGSHDMDTAVQIGVRLGF